MLETKKRRKSAVKKARHPYLVKDYLIDCSRANMLYGALVRTTESSGRITNIDAENVPDGYFLYTARDIPGKNCVKTFGVETEIFCQGEVHYSGEPVGILVGPDIKTVRQIASEIKITILDESEDELEEVEEVNESIEPEEIVDGEKSGLKANTPEKGDVLEKEAGAREARHQEKAGLDKSGRKTVGEEGKKSASEKILAERKIATGFFKDSRTEEEIDEFFKSEEFDISDTWKFAETPLDWIEASGALCFFEGSTLTILTSTQWPSHIQMNVAAALGIDESRIEVRKTFSQIKNNNGAWRTSVLALQAAIAAFISGRPIKLLLSSHEQERFMNSGISLEVSQRTSLDSNGRIRAMQIAIDGDAGYVNPFSEEIANRISIAVVNLYSIGNLSVSTTIKSTRKIPTSMALETVVAGAFFAIENHMQHIADETGILPDEIRLLNIHKDGEGSPFIYKNIRYSETMKALVDKSDFHRKYASFRMNSLRNSTDDKEVFKSLPLRGIALACATEGSCFLGNRLAASSQRIEMTLELDGSLTVNASVYSGSIYEIWKKIISDSLQIEMELIKFTSEFENGIENHGALPDGLASNVSLMTMLVKKCCAEIQRKRFHAPLPITVKKSPSSSVFRGWSKENFSGTPFYTSSFGSAIVEVEINPDTYSHKVTGIWVAVDCGEILSLAAVESTIKLCITQEIAHLIPDVKVYLPQIKIFFVQSTNPPSQISSLIHNLIPAAYTAALSQATSRIVRSIPCRVKNLFELIGPLKTRALKNHEVKSEKSGSEETSSLVNENQVEKMGRELKDKKQIESHIQEDME